MVNENFTVSHLIDSQFPDFVSENHPRFLEFIRAYYEWMETQNNPLYESKNILKNQDVDYAQEKYLEQLFKEFLVHIPRNIVVDKANLLKNIRQFYRTRGTERSYELFFRFLYGLNCEFYYPRVDILKVSDGKWIEQKTLRVFATQGTPISFVSNRIRGRTSNTTAFVERVVLIQESSFTGHELILNRSSITGNFLPGETIELDVPNTAITARISPVASQVTFSKALDGSEYNGAGYSVGQKFKINYIGEGLEVEVVSVGTLGQIQKLKIVDYGLGYEQSFPIVQYPLTSPSATQTALVDVTLGAIITYDGYYLNQDGQLSALKYIHDGEYYQQFSYVLYVDESFNTYKSLLNDLLHPVGFKVFGGLRTQTRLDAKLNLGVTNSLFVRKLTSDIINATNKIHTGFSIVSQITKSNFSNALGPTRNSVYRERYNYKPVSKYNANSEISHVPNYFGIFGDLSAQKAITPVAIFDSIGLTPANIEMMPYETTNILPDAVIKTEII